MVQVFPAFRPRVSVFALISAGLLLGACAAAGVPAPEGVPAGAPLVAQDNLAFSPSTLTVGLGERIYFWNGETAIHNLVFDGDAPSLDMEAGDVVEWRFEAAGEHVVTCDYHPQMRLRVTVEP